MYYTDQTKIKDKVIQMLCVITQIDILRDTYGYVWFSFSLSVMYACCVCVCVRTHSELAALVGIWSVYTVSGGYWVCFFS